jgi:hypothetical protein
VTISLHIPSRRGNLIFTALVASAGFALISCARVSNQPFRVTLQVGCVPCCTDLLAAALLA